MEKASEQKRSPLEITYSHLKHTAVIADAKTTGCSSDNNPFHLTVADTGETCDDCRRNVRMEIHVGVQQNTLDESGSEKNRM